MLFTLGLLLLLTPLPSCQTTTNEKRDARGSNVTKTNTVLTLLKPKTTATPSKQSVHPTLKPNTVNRIILPTSAFNQKLTANPATATKSRLSLAVNQTTLLAAVKPTTTTSTIVNKDKHKVNQTVSDKLPSLNEFKANEVRPAPTRAPNVQSTFTRLPPTRKITKDKLRPSGNHTSSVTSSTSGASNLKDKSAQSAQSTAAKIVSASGNKTSKNKTTVSVNQFVTDHPRNDENSKDKPAPTKIPDHPHSSDEKTKDKPAPTKVPDHPHSSNEKTKDKPAPTKVPDHPHSSNEKTKDKPALTKVADLPHSSDQKTKDKPATTNVDENPLRSDEKTKDKPATTKDEEQTHSSNEKTINKSARTKVTNLSLSSNEKTKDKPVPTKVADLPHSGDQKSKDKPATTKVTDLPHSSDQNSKDKSATTNVADLPHSGDQKSKDKPATTKVTDLPHSSDQKSKDKSATTNVADLPHSGDQKTKDKPATKKVADLPHSGDQKSKDKPATTKVTDLPHSSDQKSKDKPATTNVQSTPAKGNRTDGSATDKDKVLASTNHTSSTPSTTSKEKLNKSIKVVISNDCNSNQSKGQDVTLKPGAPLVMTHKISLLPGGCTGECEAEMATLKGRVAKLEKQISLLIEKCPCSANCPNDCSGNGKCEKGKCMCHQGFMGPYCTSKCAQGDCSKKANEKAKETQKTLTEPVNKGMENVTKEETKGKKTGPEDKDIATKVASNAKEGVVKTLKEIQEVSDEKSSKKDGGNQEVRQEKTETKVFPTVGTKLDKKKTKINPKSDHPKDEPQSNVTQDNNLKKRNETTKTGTNPTLAGGTKKDPKNKESPGKSTPTGKNDTRPTGNEHIKKGGNKNEMSKDSRKTGSKTEKEKDARPSQDPTIKTTTEKRKVLENKTVIQSSGSSTKSMGGLGSVRVENISSYSFTITWLAPKGMFKNFTLIRKEPLTESDKEEQEGLGLEASEKDMVSAAWNSTGVQSESTNSTISSSQTVGSKSKTETTRISMVIPGSVRSMEFSNLRADTRYALQIYGSTADRRSKIHRVTATTGPEPPTELVFSNVTEYSLAVSWTKPNTIFTGFQITYINTATGKSRFVTVGSKQTQVVLSEMSAGSSYIISVTTTKGRAQSDKLTSVITTVPAPPIHLQVNNVTDTRAMLQWTPSLGKVDRFIISYESSKTPNVTVTVMLSGNSVQYELKGLQRGTLYKVKVLSQKDSLKSVAISTTFTTANVIKASEIGARSAVIVWRTPVVYHSYRIIYQVEGEVAKEVILEPTSTEYKLTGLLPLSRYTVLVQGEKNGLYTPVVTSQFITGKLRFPFPTECSQELLNGALESGEVDIYPQGKEGRAVRVYCDMESDGGGWTVFQRRMNGKTDFYRNWSDYKVGFGNLSDEFWLGNDLLHNLTSMGPVSLRVDMKSGNDTAYAHFTNFSIASEEKNYTLTVSGYTGTAGDSMKYHNGRPFSARDRNPDPLGIHCSRAYMGGWWYKNCYKANLNGLYGINSNNQGVVWIDWKGKDSSIPLTEMKFRPSRFSPATHG